MHGIGTLINAGAIILGGILGQAGSRFLKADIRDALIKVNGMAVIVVGLSGTLKEMFSVNNGTVEVNGTMMMIASLAIGTIIGEIINIDGAMERFGIWLKKKTGNDSDDAFVNAFVSASLTVCIGAMAVVGAIQDGMQGDYTTLLVKSVLDFLIIMVMTSSLGRGCLFAFIPVAVFQGAITLLASFIAPVMTEQALSNLSLTGNILVACVGINLIWPKTFRIGNMLPAILIAVIWAYF